jgi:alcohol dehydrogenase class IV
MSKVMADRVVDADSRPIRFQPPSGLRVVVAGEGCVADRMAAELEDLRIERPLVVCGANVARSATLEIVRAALGRPSTLFAGSRPHTPAETVDAGAAIARECRADAIVAVGGSAAVDCAKGIAVLSATGLERVAQLEPLRFQNLFERRAVGRPPIPLLAVTTTLSFAEFLPFWGARDADARRKRPYSDQGCVERTIFLDGTLAAQTPDAPWLETGIKALDDAVSAYCRASGPEPFLDPVLERGIGELVEWLPRSRSSGASRSRSRREAVANGDPGARQRVLTACWMTKTALPTWTPPTIGPWLSTAVRHALGAVCEARHGAASCVALPGALRFHAEATRARQRSLAVALRWSAEGEVPLERGLRALLDEIEVPRRLSDLGVGREALAEVTRAVLEEAAGLGSEDAVRAAIERMASS